MPTTEKPSFTDDFSGIGWSHGSARDATHANQLRIEGSVDKIREDDVNDLRKYLERMWNHEHEYVDNAGGGGTTTCG